VEQGDTRVMLTDIVGDEDHHGHMDFKVAGSREGITGVQVDLKINGLPPAYIAEILTRARDARLKILDRMAETLAEPRPEISPYAPKIITITIPVDKIGALIGPSGKNVRKIQEETGTTISIEDDGTVQIAGDSLEQAEAGREMVEMQVAEAEVGKIYEGPVTRIMNFGAFVKILPDVEGMVHISSISEERVEKIDDVLKEGDIVKVRVIEIDDKGRVNLTMRDLDKPFDPESVKPRRPSSDRGKSRGRGSRPHDRNRRRDR
jgi:polyribonucleotide nucleotidyltransferase